MDSGICGMHKYSMLKPLQAKKKGGKIPNQKCHALTGPYRAFPGYDVCLLTGCHLAVQSFSWQSPAVAQVPQHVTWPGLKNKQFRGIVHVTDKMWLVLSTGQTEAWTICTIVDHLCKLHALVLVTHAGKMLLYSL